MKNELISVIVPVYNVRDYVEACTESMINQTYKDLEIILVDDGSTDDCGEICDRLAEKDSRIKVVHKVNGGLSDARNAGMKAASGKYFIFLDGDDFYHPQAVEHLVSTAEKYDADIVAGCHISSSKIDFGDFCAIDITDSQTEEFHPKSAMIDMFDTHNYFYIMAWAKLYRRELFDTIVFPKGMVHEDMAIMHLLFEKARRVAGTKACVYYVNERDGSITRSVYKRSRMECWYKYYSRRFAYYKKDKVLSKHISRGYLKDMYMYWELAYDAKDREMAGKLYRLYRRCMKPSVLSGMKAKHIVKYILIFMKLTAKQLIMGQR